MAIWSRTPNWSRPPVAGGSSGWAGSPYRPPVRRRARRRTVHIKRCRGLTVFAKLENPKGARVDRLLVGDRPVDPQADYPVAFVTSQGAPERYGRDRRTLDVDSVSALQQWFVDHVPGETDLPPSVLIV